MTDTIEKNGLENLPEGVTKEQLLDIVEQVSGSRQETRAVEEIQIGNISAARVRLEKLKAQRKPIVELFEYEGEVFYIRRLNYQDLIMLSLSAQRDRYNALNIDEGQSALSSSVVILSRCVCNEDGTPYFNDGDIEDYFASPDDAGLLTALAMRCIEANPDILATLKKS